MTKTDQALKETEEFVRHVLLTSFKQELDDEDVHSVAKKIRSTFPDKTSYAGKNRVGKLRNLER